MPTALRMLLVALIGAAMVPISADARGAGSYRGLRGYQAAVIIGPRAYPWPPAPPAVLRHYDLRGLDPLPAVTSAYREPYELSGPGASLGVYRPATEAVAPAPAPVPTTTLPEAVPTPVPGASPASTVPVEPPRPNVPGPSTGLEIVPAPAPATGSNTAPHGPREF
jgi:hypothetical protein